MPIPCLLELKLACAHAALKLTGALEMRSGSCAFEEGTCGFDSEASFLPWILNEEGKELRGQAVDSSPWLFSGGNLSLTFRP